MGDPGVTVGRGVGPSVGTGSIEGINVELSAGVLIFTAVVVDGIRVSSTEG